MIDYVALATELIKDPLKVGYAPLIASGSDTDLAALLNALTGPGAGTVPGDPISAADFVSKIAAVELISLTSLQLTQVQIVTAAQQIKVAAPEVQKWIANTWPSNTAPSTNAALSALVSRIGSRAEVLFGNGTVISDSDISKALRGK